MDELGTYWVEPLADVTVKVPETLTLFEVIGVPPVLILKIGKFIWLAAGAKDGFDSAIVNGILLEADAEPCVASTVIELVALTVPITSDVNSGSPAAAAALR
jgi:hypothetical protein